MGLHYSFSDGYLLCLFFDTQFRGLQKLNDFKSLLPLLFLPVLDPV
jgi:hypothetical protein